MRLNGAVELALGEAEAADEGEHAAGMRIHGHDRAAHLGHLLQRPLALDRVLALPSLGSRGET